jgi:hypothetical protein
MEVEDSNRGPEGPQAARTLSAKEWEQIETVSQPVRQVAVAMLAEAEEIAQSCSPASAAARCQAPLPFCAETWAWLRGPAAPKAKQQPKKKPKQGGGKAALVASLEAKAREELRAKAESARAPEAPPPRLETFGKRTEGFAAALEAWAGARSGRSGLDVVVSCARGAALLRTRCGDEAAAQALEAAAGATAERLGGPWALLEEAIANPDPLVRPSFAGAQQVTLYPEQKAVARALGEAVLASRPLLLRYVTPPSGGKSSAAALFGATLSKVLETRGVRKGERPYVIYACFSNAVRVEVSRTVLAASVPFAVVTAGLASPSYRCFHSRESARRARPKYPPPPGLAERVEYSVKLMGSCDRHPVVLVCDLESACAYRSRKGAREDVLLLDELTVGSETAEHSTPVGASYARLLQRVARYTVLMSATVPEFSQLPTLLGCFCRLHDCVVADCTETQSSRRLSIGIEARDGDGSLWLPHHCEGALEALLADDPDGHLLRFYGPEGLRRALQDLRLDPAEVLAVRDFVSHDALREAVCRVLRQHRASLAKPTAPQEALDADACAEASGLATEGSWQFPGCTLVVAEGGSGAFYQQAMLPLLGGVPPVRRLLVKPPKEKKERSRKPDSDEDERDEPVTAPVQRVRWPPEAVVNSREHFDKYGRRASGAALASKDRKASPNVPDSILETSAVPVVESALGGVVLLDSCWGDRAFELCGLALADTAQPSFVVSDTRLVYGVNMPVNRVLVLLGDGALGLDEVRQLCGRAGRTGKCSKAEVVFRSRGLLRAALSPKPAVASLDRAPLDVLLERALGGGD